MIFQRENPQTWGPEDIRKLRAALGISQKNLASHLGAHELTVLGWERALDNPRHKYPDARFQQALNKLEGELQAAQRKAQKQAANA